jgi:hypothetical protein
MNSINDPKIANNKLAAATCSRRFLARRFLIPWRWMRYVPLKRRLTQYLHGATSKNTAFLIVTAMNTSTLACLSFTKFRASACTHSAALASRDTVRLAVCSQSDHLGDKPLENHDYSFCFQLSPFDNSPYVTSSLTKGRVCLLWIRLAFAKCTYRTYSVLLKTLPCALE